MLNIVYFLFGEIADNCWILNRLLNVWLEMRNGNDDYILYICS